MKPSEKTVSTVVTVCAFFSFLFFWANLSLSPMHGEHRAVVILEYFDGEL